MTGQRHSATVRTATRTSCHTMPDSPAADFYDNIEKKMVTQINKYQRENPELRRKLKLMLSGLGSSNTVITIRADKENQTRESKYMTESYKIPSETARKYLEGE